MSLLRWSGLTAKAYRVAFQLGRVTAPRSLSRFSCKNGSDLEGWAVSVQEHSIAAVDIAAIRVGRLTARS